MMLRIVCHFNFRPIISPTLYQTVLCVSAGAKSPTGGLSEGTGDMENTCKPYQKTPLVHATYFYFLKQVRQSQERWMNFSW